MVGENGVPETPDWACTPHPAPEFEPLVRMRPQEPEIPENVILGTE